MKWSMRVALKDSKKKKTHIMVVLNEKNGPMLIIIEAGWQFMQIYYTILSTSVQVLKSTRKQTIITKQVICWIKYNVKKNT